MKKTYHFYNAGPGAGEAGGVAAAAAADTAGANVAPGQENQAGSGEGQKEQQFKSFADLNIPADGNIDDIEKALGGKKETEEKGEEKKDDAKPGEKAPKAEVDPDMPILDLEDEPQGQNQEEKEATWKDLSAHLELDEPEDDSFDGFKTAYSKKLDLIRNEGREEGRKEYVEKIAAMQPEARALFDFLQVEGNTVEGFMKPLAQIDNYLAKTDEELIREDLKARRYEDGMIEEKLEELRIDNKVKTHAYDIRKQLESIREQRQQEIVQEARDRIRTSQEEKARKAEQELTAFKGAITEKKDLWGVPITQKAKDIILQRFQAGQYRERLQNDPNLAAEIALLIEFKDQLQKQLTGNAKIEGKEGLLKKVHQVSLGQQASASQSNPENELQGFDVWEQHLKEESKK